MQICSKLIITIKVGILKWMKLADLQRGDMGIAMSHFELTAREMGLDGRWQIKDEYQSPEMEYIVSWVIAQV